MIEDKNFKIIKALDNILDNYYDLEKDHYNEFDKPENHIFLYLFVVKSFLEIIKPNKQYD